MLTIGPYQIKNNLFVAPMAGVTDRPFRQLCRNFGAGYTVGEMVSANQALWSSLKTSTRLNHQGEIHPIAVQIAGTEALMMAKATRYNIERGAQIIDINMGCPAKKVCTKYAGAALMRDEKLAAQIITAVVKTAAEYRVPVSLKIRTGWDEQHKNALNIGQIAEQAGIQLLTIHGRTKQQGYAGQAEYDSIARIKQRLTIPIVANGDIDSPEKAQYVLNYTGADAIMIGRAAQGRPWLFREIAHYLATGSKLPALSLAELKRQIIDHINDHFNLYGATVGAKSVRKHIGWYARFLPEGQWLRQQFNVLNNAEQQFELIEEYFSLLPMRELKLS